MKNEKQPAPAKPAKLAASLIIVAVTMLVGMSAFQIVKNLIFRDLVLWDSHLITIIFSAVTATVAAFFILRKRDALIAEIRKDAVARDAAVAEVTESERRFRNLFETMAQGVVYHNAEGYLTAANPAALDILGLSLDELQGRTSMDPRWRAVHEDGSDFPGETHPAMVALKTGEPVRDTIMGIYHPREERYRWILVNAIPEYRAGESKPCRVFATFEDVTGLKQAQDAVKSSERKWRSIIDTAPSVILVLSPDHKIREFNTEAERMCGMKRSNAVGKDYFDLCLPADVKAAVAADMDKVLAGAPTKGFENVVRDPGGEERTLAWSVNRLGDHGEEAAGVIAVGQDITARKEAEEALKESQGRLERTLESMTDAFFTLDKGWRFTYVNHRAEKLLDRKTGELLGKNLWEEFPEAAVSEFQAQYSRAIREQKRVAFETFYPPLGLWFEVHASPYQDGLSVYFADVTERKGTQEALEESSRTQGVLNDLLRLSLEDIPLDEQLQQAVDTILQSPFMPLEPKGGLFLVEGDRPELTMKASRNLPPTLLGMCGKVPFGECLCGKAAAGGKLIFSPGVDERHDHRYEGMVPHGHYNVPMLSRATKGKVLGLIVLYVRSGHRQSDREEAFLQAVANTLAGLIERRQAVDAVKTSEQRYRTLAEAAPDSVIITDREHRVTYANSSAAAAFRLQPEELISRTIPELFPKDQARITDNLDQVLKTGKATSFEDKAEFPGGTLWLDVNVVPLKANGAVYAAMTVTKDITERKNREILSRGAERINAAINSTLDFEEIMQTVVSEATKAIGCESALILLREEDRWVMSYVNNFPKEHLGKRYSDATAKSSKLAVETGKPVVVNDAFHDDRVNPLVMKKFSIRSVLTVPLMRRDEPVGSLLFQYNSAPVAFTEAQIDFASRLATSVSLAIENAHLYTAQRKIADTLQGSLLTMPSAVEHLDLSYLYRSASVEVAQVGGDFYDVFELAENRVGIVIGDVSGKGLGAATLTSLVKNTIRAYAETNESPASVLTSTNQLLIKASAPAMFMTVFFAVLHKSSGDLTYCGAGHPPGIVKRPRGETRFLETDSPALGIFSEFTFHNHHINLAPGDTLLLYTDGTTEARHGSDLFGEEQLFSFISDLKTARPAKMTEALFSEINRFSGGVLADDIALLAVSPKP